MYGILPAFLTVKYMKDDKEKFWEIVDGVEIRPFKIHFFANITLLVTLVVGLTLLIVGVSTYPLISIAGYLISLYGLSTYITRKYFWKDKVNSDGQRL